MPMAKPFVGMIEDLKRRKPFYWSDWKDGMHWKVLAASLFMVFTSIAPAITFSATLQNSVKDAAGVSQLGPVEVILSTAITGSAFAIFAGQPLCIVGVTGPVVIFTTAMAGLTTAMDIAFLPFYAWVQIWTAIMICTLSVLNACDLIKLVTRYSCETFGLLIAVIYLFTGVKNLVICFGAKAPAAALLSFVLAVGTTLLALSLTGARSWTVFKGWMRVVLADYGATIAILFFCFVPYMGGLNIYTPSYVGNTTMNTIDTLAVPSTFGTTSGRGWFVNPLDCPVGSIFIAIGPAIVLTILFFFDHNVSSLLCQAPEFKLKKGSAYHWDFFVVGLLLLLTGLLGLPPVNGLIPQAPLHTDSLCNKKRVPGPNGSTVEQIVDCYENRVSNLLQAVIIGCTLPALTFISDLPVATLDGIFLYMGLASLAGNTFYQRILLFFTSPDMYESRGLSFLGKVPIATVYKFTIFQVLILATIFVVTLLPYVAALFPLFIGLLVPLRSFWFPKVFGLENVEAMDASVMGGGDDEEAREEVDTQLGEPEPEAVALTSV